MIQSGDPAAVLRIYTDEHALSGDHPLHQVVLRQARLAGLAGATVFRGLDGFGHASHLHSHPVPDLSPDAPLVIEIVDEEENIRRFLPFLEGVREIGLVTLGQTRVLRYGPAKTSAGA